MVDKQLTGASIADGHAPIDALDRAGLAPQAALCLYTEDPPSWKLVIAASKVGVDGPREVYRAVQKALSERPHSELPFRMLRWPSRKRRRSDSCQKPSPQFRKHGIVLRATSSMEH